ncbi:AAA family ATPase [Candidatus Woesearchaeota archaeon]|nr:AAA family ATPase [Candidatus Woesearchaeota archaeon]
MKITISGLAGSGKSTVAKLLAERLNYEYYSLGQLMREIAKERKSTIMELSRKAEKDDSIDRQLDEKQKGIGRKSDNFVMDSRLGFHFIPDSFKIFLDVDVKEAAKRVHRHDRTEEKYNNLDEASEHLERRMQSEKRRYEQYYDIEFPLKEHFDLVIDTTDRKPGEIVGIILEKIKER